MPAREDNHELHELKHEAKPGYGRIFAIVFAAMGLYLALILISSPGPAKNHGHHGEIPVPSHP